MRAFLACWVSLAAAASTAHADPALASYIDGGLEGGGDADYLAFGGRVELATRVAPALWIHGILADGGLGRLLATGSGTYTRLRAGADLMSCGSSGVLCMFAGADVGYQHSVWTGHDDPLFGDSTNVMDTTDEHDRVLGIVRIGLDIGGTNVRWRPSIEGALSNAGVAGFTGTQSIAYRF